MRSDPVTRLLQPPDVMRRYIVVAAHAPTTNAETPATMLPGSPITKLAAAASAHSPRTTASATMRTRRFTTHST